MLFRSILAVLVGLVFGARHLMEWQQARQAEQERQIELKLRAEQAKQAAKEGKPAAAKPAVAKPGAKAKAKPVAASAKKPTAEHVVRHKPSRYDTISDQMNACQAVQVDESERQACLERALR